MQASGSYSHSRVLSRESGSHGGCACFTSLHCDSAYAICSLPGPPLSAQSQIAVLLKHNVTVGIGTALPEQAMNTRFDAAWVSCRSHRVA